MADLEEIFIDGQSRKMGRTLPQESHRLMRSTMRSFTQYLDQTKQKLIPRSEWKPVRNRTMFGRQYCNNQLRYGACVGASCAMVFAKGRVIRGQPFVNFSWAYIYDQVNNGRDNGACITDVIAILLAGVPPYEDYDAVPQFNRNKQPASRSRFKSVEALTLSSFDEMGTAIQMGFYPQYPVQVGTNSRVCNYNKLSADFVCGFDPGPGNHSVHSDGMDFLSSINQWAFDHMGSWSTNWGDEGRGWHTERHIQGAAVPDDAYCLIDVAEDPNDSENLPNLN